MKNSAAWTSKHSEQTTDIVSHEKVEITHPFLPNYKKEYVLKAHIKRGPKSFLLCTDEEENEVLLPVGYTNLGKTRLSDDQREGVPCFAYSDLVELHKLLDSIEDM